MKDSRVEKGEESCFFCRKIMFFDQFQVDMFVKVIVDNSVPFSVKLFLVRGVPEVVIEETVSEAGHLGIRRTETLKQHKEAKQAHKRERDEDSLHIVEKVVF